MRTRGSSFSASARRGLKTDGILQRAFPCQALDYLPQFEIAAPNELDRG